MTTIMWIIVIWLAIQLPIGLLVGKILHECGMNREAYMTEPRPLPNNCKTAIFEAADDVASARLTLKKLANSNFYPELKIMSAILDLTEALRWLESIGAPTRPEQL